VSRTIAIAAVALLLAGAPVARAAENAATPVPDFSGTWVGDNEFKFQEPASGTGPIGDLPGHVHVQRGTDAQGRDVSSNAWVGNYESPVLTPWAQGLLKTKAEAAMKGHDPFWAPATCWPGGINVILWPEPTFFLQSPKEVTIIYQRDHQVRHVYLNAQHSANPTPSWYGESVGHYDGNTLVIDTIGMNTQNGVDRYGTPHSEDLRIIERYTVSPDGKMLTGVLTFDDPKAYTQKWSGVVKYHRTNAPLQETICAETPVDLFTGKAFAIPIASRPGF
jgi:hypothetical protein